MSRRPIARSFVAERALPAIVAVVACLALVVVALDWDSPVRAAIVLLFLLFGPGLAIVALLRVRDLAQQIALAAAASLALDTTVAVTLLYLGRYSYEVAFAIVVAATLVALCVGAFRSVGARAVARPPSRRADA